MSKPASDTPLPGAMPGRTPENAAQPVDFKPLEVARSLLHATRAGTLATLDRNTGHPFGSLVNVATNVDGSPLILASRLATHSANLEQDGRASLLLAETKKGDALAHPRLTVLGSMVPIARDSDEEPAIRRRFLARHPKSELYAGFGDFTFWRMQVASAHLNGGFARAADLTAADVLTDINGAQALLEAEEGAIAHINADHADACRLFATRLLGSRDGDWTCVGINPDGIELQRGQKALWLPFPQRIIAPGALRAVLKDLAEKARGS
jgi:putative heme iron utilization protein